jgi:hypothetical protein
LNKSLGQPVGAFTTPIWTKANKINPNFAHIYEAGNGVTPGIAASASGFASAWRMASRPSFRIPGRTQRQSIHGASALLYTGSINGSGGCSRVPFLPVNMPTHRQTAGSSHPLYLSSVSMPWTHRSFWIGPLIVGAILALLFLLFSQGRLHRIYTQRFQESRRERLFLASLGFFVTVLVVRGITLAIHYDVGPFHDVSMHGRHIHHMVWGILLLLIVGYCWLIEVGNGSIAAWPVAGRLTATLYGVAAALILDEFALWLNLSDVYWQREGRESYEAMALFGSLLAVGLFGVPLFRGLIKEARSLFGR